MNKEFYHQTVDSKTVENYISRKSGKDLSKIFDQYLRKTNIPELEYKINRKAVSFRWNNCIAGFNMPVKISFGQRVQWIKPTKEWQTIHLGEWFDEKTFSADKNFYITTVETD